MPTVTRANVAIAVTVQGVPQVFVERAVPAALFVDEAGSDRAQQVCLGRDSVVLGRRVLDLEARARAESGADISVTLRDRGATDAGATYGLSLAALFAARSYADSHLTVAIAESAVMAGAGTLTLAVGGGAAFAVGDHDTRTAYVGGEAFIYTGTGTSTLTGVTRAAHGTVAQQHHDGTGMAAIDASGVWVSALPGWRSREVTIYAVDVDAGTKEQIAQGILGGPPQLEDATSQAWTLSATSMADHFRERRFGVGLRATVPVMGEEEFAGDGVDGVQFQVPDDDLELFAASGNYPTLLAAELDSGHVSLLWNDGVSGSDKVLGTGGVPYLWPDGLGQFLDSGAAQSMAIKYRTLRHIAVVEGAPAEVALNVLLSDLGDKDSAHSTTYDVLPGNRSAAIDEPEWRFGAALLAGQVDAASFLAIGSDGGVMTMVIGFDAAETVGDFLADWCAMVGAYWFVDTSGRISVARMRDRTPPSETSVSVAVTDATLAVSSPEGLAVDESAIAATHTLIGNYDPLEGRHTVTVDVSDRELARRYPGDGGHIVTSSKLTAILVNGLRPPPAPGEQRWIRVGGEPLEAVRHRLRRGQAANGRPSAAWSGVVTGWGARAVNPGDIIQVTNARLPDLTGGVHSSAAPWLVTGVHVDLSALTVALDLRSLAIGYVIAPCFEVDSGSNPYTASPSTAALRYGGASPGNHFADLWDVWCMDDTGVNAPERKTVTAHTATTLTLDAAPSFAPSHIIPDAPESLSGGGDGTEANDAGHTRADFLIQCGDDGTYDVASYPGTRWS